MSRISPATPVVTMMPLHPLIRELTGYRLFVGPAAVLEHPEAVCGAGVEAVVCVAPEKLPDPWPRDLMFLRIPLSDDGENAPQTLRRAVQTVSTLIQDDVPTLIVCSMGHSRSIAVAAAAISQQSGADANEVLRRITAGRPADVSPSLWDSLQRV